MFFRGFSPSAKGRDPQATDEKMGVSILHLFSSTPFYHRLKEIATYFFGLYVNNRGIWYKNGNGPRFCGQIRGQDHTKGRK